LFRSSDGLAPLARPTHLHQPVTVRAAYMADRFQPAERLMALALNELAGAAYDQLKD
jgi:hypothetical protein